MDKVETLARFTELSEVNLSGWRKMRRKSYGFYKERYSERKINQNANIDPKRPKYTKKAIENLSYEQAHQEAERIIAEYRSLQRHR